MAIVNTKLGGTDLPTGADANSADQNDTLDVCAGGVMLFDSIYTGTDLDSAVAGTKTHTIAISASELREAKYLKVNVTAKMNASCPSVSDSASTQLKVETQETGGGGGGFSTLYQQGVSASTSGSHAFSEQTNLGTITLIKATTADERTKGIDVKFSSILAESGGGAANFNNQQIWFEGKN